MKRLWRHRATVGFLIFVILVAVVLFQNNRLTHRTTDLATRAHAAAAVTNRLSEQNAELIREFKVTQQGRDYRACVERNNARTGIRQLVDGLLIATKSKPDLAAAAHQILDRTEPIVKCPRP